MSVLPSVNFTKTSYNFKKTRFYFIFVSITKNKGLNIHVKQSTRVSFLAEEFVYQAVCRIPQQRLTTAATAIVLSLVLVQYTT